MKKRSPDSRRWKNNSVRMKLTGGSSKMEGLIDLAEEVFHMPVRLGIPQYVTGLVDVVRNPIYATGVGLLLFGHHNRSSRLQQPIPSTASSRLSAPLLMIVPSG